MHLVDNLGEILTGLSNLRALSLMLACKMKKPRRSFSFYEYLLMVSDDNWSVIVSGKRRNCEFTLKM